MRKLLRPLRYLFSLILEGDETWGNVRALIAVGLLLGLALAGRWLEPFASGERWIPELIPWVQRLPILGLIPIERLADLDEFVRSLFSLNALRYWLAPLAALAFGLTLGTLYLQEVFEFKNFGQAWKYMVAALFGEGYPTLTIQDGKTTLKLDEANTLATIGGPGYLEVRPGSAVLLERGVGPTNVYGAGRYFIRRFEMMREILDLREIYRRRAEVEATTKDGISITLRDVEATFRLDTGRQPQRTEVEPYPFSVKAARAAVYGRAVDKSGQIMNWGDLIIMLISARIRTWVGRLRLDRLTAPIEDDPRAALRAEFDGPQARAMLARFGAELVRVNIGHLDTPGQVDSQRLDNWQSFWESHDKVTKAQGEALQVAYEELGRAEG